MTGGREIVSLIGQRQDLDQFRKKNWEGTFDQYLDLVTQDGRATRNAFQRVYDNRHWLSDVVGAAFLGHAVGKELVHFHYRHDIDGVLQPYLTQGAVGMEITLRF